MPAPTSIGQRFTQLIQHLGLSKNAFAQSLDKTATVIQHLVDERNKPGYDLLCKVFEVYPNVSKDWLMEGAGPMLKPDAASAIPASLEAPATPAADLFAAPIPAAAQPRVPAEAPTPVAALAPVAAVAVELAPPVAVSEPVASPAPVSPLAAPAANAPAPAVASPAPVPVVEPAPDPAYLTAALQTQYLQHQLALAEQRNQHLLEQQALMQQLVAVLQRAV